MNQVYIVVEVSDNIDRIGGVYASLVDARDHATDIAEYAGFEPVRDDVWGDDDHGVRIDVHEVN
jgi:hypothetical protein